MTVLFDGIPLRFWFERPGRRTTTAHCLYRGVNYSAGAVCSDGDQFIKAVGRRVALGRMLWNGLGLVGRHAAAPDLEFSREMRRVVWAAYFAAHRDLKVVK
jgi:hypothetical protein